jgi:hypothetical protein
MKSKEDEEGKDEEDKEKVKSKKSKKSKKKVRFEIDLIENHFLLNFAFIIIKTAYWPQRLLEHI